MPERSFSLDSMVRGYHIYRTVWEAAVGEELECVQEVGNRSDPYTVVVVKPQDEVTFGHLPRKISSLCSMLLQRGGTISCTVTGEKRYSHDLPQGGLEIPCQLKFTGNDKDVSQIQKLVQGFLTKASCSCGEQNNKLTEQKASVKNAS